MRPMTGEIGKLSVNGEQVGGFKYWTAVQNRDSLQTIVRASKFWMLKPVTTDRFQCEFYSHNPDDNLKMVCSTEATIKLPEYELDKMQSKVIEMNLGEFDWLEGFGR